MQSCSTQRPEGETEAEVLYQEAQDLFESRRYLLATERLNTLRSRYPYSFYAAPAELLQANILFKQSLFAEAAAAYTLFRDFHPRHSEITFVLFRIGESHFRQIPRTYDRDLSPARDAIYFFTELINRHPNSEYVSEAREKIEEASLMLQNRERYVADFYFRTKVYESARYRYQQILQQFDSLELRDEAMLRIVKSSVELEELERCRNDFEAFINSISEKNKRKLQRAARSC